MLSPFRFIIILSALYLRYEEVNELSLFWGAIFFPEELYRFGDAPPFFGELL